MNRPKTFGPGNSNCALSMEMDDHTIYLHLSIYILFICIPIFKYLHMYTYSDRYISIYI